jgi:DNA-directed RNA polymerase subunit H (RpoH/RPB5)
MNYEELDVLYRSRRTLLNILKQDEYVTTQYETFGPWEIEAMAAAGPQALQMTMKRPVEGSRPNTVRVMFSLTKLKQKLSTFISDLTDAEKSTDTIDPATTEVIVIVLEDVADVFHTAALNAWISDKKIRIRFFKAHNLILDPREHVLVPPHIKVPPEEHAELLKQSYIRSKMNLPFIRFHEDMIGRIMGLLPGDIVKITRPSPAAGLYDIYRVCVP